MPAGCGLECVSTCFPGADVTLKKLGRYEVLRVLGKGAMGVVYEGRDPNLDRRVAIKTVKVENLSEEAAAEYEHRFRTEARSAARLQHPNIVSVYDSDRDGDVAFLVMEYIQGDDLKHHLDRGVRYSLEQSLKIIRDLLSALDYAHKQGIVHRDIKPANLLIEPGGRVKLTDFGVARIQDSGEATRTQGSMVGTLKYMAPEQVQGQKIDSRADLFSAGVCLYQLLTDKRPFDGDNDFSIIHQIIGHAPPPPSSINAKLPSALDAVVARALAKTREERFATARDFAVALQAAIRRAEDQTVVPPLNPNKHVEPGASRPLTVPGTVPPGSLTTPSIGGASSVTQELELVYWKDVKDSSDAEELQGFLDKFPAGIYADLARRRLRKLVGGEATNIGFSQPGMPGMPSAGTMGATGSTFAATQFPDAEATRMRTDASRPAARADTVPPRPMQWAHNEYTNTMMQPGATSPGTIPPAAPATIPPAPAQMAPTLSGAAAAATYAAAAGAMAAPSVPAAPAPVARPVADDSDFPPTEIASGGDSTFPATQMMESDEPARPASRKRRLDDDDTEDSRPVAPARRKVPLAALAGVGALAVAGVLAFVLTRGKDIQVAEPPVAAVAPASPAAAGAAPAAAPPVAPADVPVVPPQSAAVAAATMPPDTPKSAAPPAEAVPPPAPAKPAAQAPARKPPAQPATRTARATTPEPVPEPGRGAGIPQRVEPEPGVPKTLPPAVAANGAAFAAVDQCRDKFFLARELCLNENCGKAGARNHPMCVKHREDARLREDGKIRQGPQQTP